jgi:acid phosphatase (class A)
MAIHKSCLLAICVFALSFRAQTVQKPIFVSPAQLDVASVLPNPPAADSARAKAELAELRHLRDTRQAAEIAHAKADDTQEDIFVFQSVLGEKFNAAALPLTALLSTHVHNDEGVIVGPAKEFFHRTRPFFIDTALQPVCKVNDNRQDYAYPSGHATTGYLEALVLTLMVPEQRDAILARADDYAHSRVVCGVHYRSDVDASKTVAYAMIGLMANHPQFRAELEAARAETRRALGLKPLHTLLLLTHSEIDPRHFLAPPAPDGSEAQQKEMAQVQRLIASRKPEQFARAKWDAEHEDATAFAATLGPAFDLAKLPVTSKLLAAVLNDQALAASAAKDYFHRKFPVAALNPEPPTFPDWTCDAVVRKPGERPLRSYPSGHATLGYTLGVVLAHLVPEKAPEILARADEYGYSREICGDHYHSDVEAGHTLGNAVGLLFVGNAALRPQFESARAELRAAGITK